MSFKGEHTRRVILQTRAVSTDPDTNQQISTWVDQISLHASFQDRHARQGQSDGQILVVQDTRAKIRYKALLDRRTDNQGEVNHRLVDDGVIWEILSVVPEGRRKWQILTLERKDDN